MVIWRVAEAKRSLSQLVRDAEHEPQLIHRRERLVAVVIGGEEAEEFLAWRRERSVPALSELLGELQQVAAEEAYELPQVERSDRENPLLDGQVSPGSSSAPPTRRRKRHGKGA